MNVMSSRGAAADASRPGARYDGRTMNRARPYLNELKASLQQGADMRECRDLLRYGSHSFFAASLVLPTEYRQPITALYAFCRVADDVIDDAEATAAALESLHRRLDRIYDDRPDDNAVDRAFADVVHDYDIPYTLPAALLEGFEWDIAGRRYRTMSDVYAYSARVAGTVGVMMALLMGVRDADALSRACDLGVAMQLTNIARDVGEDAAAGRLYLPGDVLARHGVDAATWLENPVMNQGVKRTIQDLLNAADRLYERAEWGIVQLPARCRPGIFAARTIYAEIGREIERRNYDSVTQRAVVGTRRKLRLLVHAIRKTFMNRGKRHAPPLKETRFLVDAVTGA